MAVAGRRGRGHKNQTKLAVPGECVSQSVGEPCCHFGAAQGEAERSSEMRKSCDVTVVAQNIP